MTKEEIKKLNNIDLVGQLISHAHTFGDFVQETDDFVKEIIYRLESLGDVVGLPKPEILILFRKIFSTDKPEYVECYTDYDLAYTEMVKMNQADPQRSYYLESVTPKANGAVAGEWSYEEFELSGKTNLTPAIWQFILRKNGTAILYSEELTLKDSNWAKTLREYLPNIVIRLNQK